jgi:sec-independent protein translocase protein TatA
VKNLNGFEWIIILVIVVLLFGANKLPGLAKGLGESIKIFRKEVKKDSAAEDAKKTKGEDAPKS